MVVHRGPQDGAYLGVALRTDCISDDCRFVATRGARPRQMLPG